MIALKVVEEPPTVFELGFHSVREFREEYLETIDSSRSSLPIFLDSSLTYSSLMTHSAIRTL